MRPPPATSPYTAARTVYPPYYLLCYSTAKVPPVERSTVRGCVEHVLAT